MRSEVLKAIAKNIIVFW